MPSKTISVTNGDGSTRTITIPDRSRFAGVRKMTSGHVYPTISGGSYNSEGVVFQKLPIGNPDEKTFTLVASNSTAIRWVNFLNPNNGIRTGKHRLEFDLVLNSGSISSKLWWNYADSDDDPYTGNGYALKQSPTVGHNSFDFEIFNDGVHPNPHIYFEILAGSTFDISVTNFKITHNYEEITVDRTADSGGRTMTVSEALGVSTTQIQVTVAGHANISGIYTKGIPTEFDWAQQGGTGRITREQVSQYNYEWKLLDNSDGAPSTFFGSGLVSETDSRPWNASASLPSSITITPVPETLTVDRSSDRKGESRPLLSKVVGGATAAYSLRDLNDKAGNNKVVRVRRASDNHERDFLAKEVSNGTLKNWVNTQVTAPLDIREIADSNSDGNNDGRVGDFLIAKAAYSLRSLGTRQATLAATGDTVARADGKYVCQVRRSSDDALKSFTATEVTDGTLLAFTNADYAKYTSDFSAGDDGWGGFDDVTETGNIDGIGGLDNNLRLAIGSATSQHRGYRSHALPANQKINFSARVFIPSTNSVVDSLGIRDASGSVIIPAGTTPAQDQWVTVTANNVTVSNKQLRVDIQDGGTNNFAGNGSDVIYLREVTITQVTSDGFVKTWYDQSVTTQAGDTATGNHAFQDTPEEQPKIVNAGSVMLNEDGHPAIGFQRISGNNTHLDLTTGIDIANSHSFQYVEFNKTYTYTLVETSGGGNNRIGYLTGSQLRLYRGGTLNFGAGISVTNNPFIYTTFIAADGSASKVNVNGDEVLNQVLGNSTGGTTFNDIFRGDNSGLDSQFTKLSELIVYDTDQTDNRTAIEANIGEVYSITGIPAYDNTVDGFVETWYDQSGNGRDAVQATAANQPKIVTRNGDAAIKSTSNDEMTFTLDSLSVDGQQSVFGVLENDVTSQDTYPRAFAASSTTADDAHGGNGANFRPRWTITPTGWLYFQVDSHGGYSNNSRERHLYSHVMNDIAGGTSTVHQDGTQVDTRSITLDANATFQSGKVLGLGTNATGALYMSEVIYYLSDQSANRPAIEANINNQYDIY